MDKEVVVGVHSEVFLSHKKERIWATCSEWMNLEPVKQSEVSQKEENKCYILMDTSGI